jgi:hypothetical protein
MSLLCRTIKISYTKTKKVIILDLSWRIYMRARKNISRSFERRRGQARLGGSQIIDKVIAEQQADRQRQEVERSKQDRQNEALKQTQRDSMIAFGEKLWGPQVNENGINNWETFTSIGRLEVKFGINKDDKYFILSPQLDELSNGDWKDGKPPVCELYVTKDSHGKVIEINGHSGPYYSPEQIVTDDQFKERHFYNVNPI